MPEIDFVNPIIDFEDPRPAKSAVRGLRTETLIPTLKALAAHPNRWAKLHTWAGANSAYTARRTLLKMMEAGFLPGQYEFAVRRETYVEGEKPSGGSVLFARYLEEEIG